MKAPESKTAKMIRTLRKSRGWTQKELAERLGMSERAITLWETGAFSPSGSSILELASVFGVAAEVFSEGEAPTPPPANSANSPEVGASAGAVLAILQGGEMKLSEAALGRLIWRVMKRAEAEGRQADQVMAREELQAMLAEMLG